ncbi:MAG: PAS domain S-box protein, partial [Desulfobacterales bacterium]|nr:PAS domain S-box protein [Desulfobacterales bacterium]
MGFIPRLFLTLLIFTATAMPIQAVEKQNVLFLNSYENGYRWSDSILAGVRSHIQEGGHPVDLRIEYMDSKRHYDAHTEAILLNYYAHKYRETRFQAIVVSDNTAFDFMLKYRHRLFPGVPLVFCGVNNFTPEIIENQPRITGIAESVEFKENLELARRLHPKSRRMVVVGNTSLTSRAIVRQIKDTIHRESIDFDIQFMTRLNTDQLIRHLKAAGPETLIFFIPFYEKLDQKFLSSWDILARVSQTTGLPIYSSWDFFLGAGLVGGKLAAGFEHGQRAAEMTLKILSGEPVRKIPVVTRMAANYIFDYNELKRFKIKKTALPRDSRIINQPHRFYELDKRLVWGLSIAFVLLSGTLFFLVLNIIKRKRVEDSLRRTEKKYRDIFKHAGKGIVIVDPAGAILEMNPAFAKMFGYASEERFMEQNKKLQNIFVSRDKRRELLEMIIKGKEVSGFELEFYTVKKEIRWASVTAKTVFYSGWKHQVIECICEDISQRKKAEMAVWESREKLRHILDNIPQLVFWQDQDMRFMEVNKSFLSFFKINRAEDIIGKKDYNLLGIGQDAQRAIDTNLAVIRSNIPRYRLKWDFQSLGSDTIWLEINKIPLHDTRGKTTGILSTAEDITQKVNLEKQLRQSQKMEALGILSGGIAHDFNNILTSIINSTELALEDVDPESITRKDLIRVLKAGARGSNLVKQILSFSRPSAHEFRPMDLGEVVEEALGLIQTSLPGNIQVHTRISPHPAPCLGDPTQISQIIMNLCTNAFQAMEQGGGEFFLSLETVALAPGDAQLLNIEPGDFLRLTIADTGPGIPPEIMDNIFDPFFTTKDKDVGTGLGLSVVHGIIKGHKGAIQV